MTIPVLAFYVFGAVIVGSGLMVIVSRNTVHSVLFLILAFFNSAGLFVLSGAEFIAMILVIVYVGAVAVLFLFIVMMLDINFVRLRQGFLQYLPIGVIIGLLLLIELILVLGSLATTPALDVGAPAPPVSEVSNVEALGELIYTRYVYLFQAAGLVLLVAMVGTIVLTHRARTGVRRQRISAQVARRREEAVELKKIRKGSGI